MKNATVRITGCAVAMVAAVSIIGCGKGFKSSGLDDVQTANIASNIKSAEMATQEAQVAMKDANSALDEITDTNGNIHVGIFFKSKAASAGSVGVGTTSASSGSSSSGSSSGGFILGGLMDRLNSVFDRVFQHVAVVKLKFEDARKALNEALGKVDPASQAAADIRTQLAKIDQLESAFSTGMHSLATKLDLAFNGLDKIISGATSFIPGWGWVVNLALDFFVMDDLRSLIHGLELKLLSL